MLIVLVSCGKKDQTAANTSISATQTQNQTDASVTSNTVAQTESTTTTDLPTDQSSTYFEGTDAAKGEELLQSASIDLNGDGQNEEVEILQTKIDSKDQPGEKETEGILRIASKDASKDVVFITKPEGEEIMKSMDFKDLDGDGAKDVFIVIPDYGAQQFAVNHYFAYDYANGKSYNFNTDAFLTDFANGFRFSYKGKGILEMHNDSYGFSADFDITSAVNGVGANDEANSDYENSWVDPNPVETNNSGITLENAADGKTEIKVPLPIFGMGAVDMIGEVDMYYAFDKDFTPVLKHFEAMDFNDDMSMKKVGEWKD